MERGGLTVPFALRGIGHRDAPHPGSLLLVCDRFVACGVCRPIVYQDELEPDTYGCEGGLDLVNEQIDIVLLIVRRCNDGEIDLLGARNVGCSCVHANRTTMSADSSS